MNKPEREGFIDAEATELEPVADTPPAPAEPPAEPLPDTWPMVVKLMRKQAEQEAKEKGALKKVYRPILVPNEQPVWTSDELKTRAKNEKMWTEAQQVQATFVVQGWKSGTGKLWEAGADVSVKSKMAMINQDLSIQSATFTQDNNSGTLTTLLCVAPWGLNGKSDYKVSPGDIGQTLDRTPGTPD